MTDSSEMLFWAKVAAIGQAVGATATAVAVIASLWVVLSERRVRLQVSAGLRLSIPGNGLDATDLITIAIVNQGQRVVRVESIAWRSGWLRRWGPKLFRQQWAMQNAPIISGWDVPPFIVEPGQKRTVAILVGNMARSAHAEKFRDLFTVQLPFFRSRTPANICVVAYVVGAKPVIAKVEKSLARFLAFGMIGGAAKFNQTADVQEREAF